MSRTQVHKRKKKSQILKKEKKPSFIAKQKKGKIIYEIGENNQEENKNTSK